MFYKKNEEFVEVYKFFENKTALIFSPKLQNNRKNGWEIVKLGQLLPENYYNANKEDFITKEIRNKIKNRLNSVPGLWFSSDGMAFKDFEKAISYEKKLIEKENETLA